MKSTIPLKAFIVGLIIAIQIPFSLAASFQQEPIITERAEISDLSSSIEQSLDQSATSPGFQYTFFDQSGGSQTTIGTSEYYRKAGVLWTGDNYTSNSFCFFLTYYSGNYTIQAEMYEDGYDGSSLLWQSNSYSSSELPQSPDYNWFCFEGPSVTLQNSAYIQINQVSGTGTYAIVYNYSAINTGSPDFSSAMYHVGEYGQDSAWSIFNDSVDLYFAIGPFQYLYGYGTEYQDNTGTSEYYKKVGLMWQGADYTTNNVCFRLRHVQGAYTVQAQIYSDAFDGSNLKWSSEIYSSTDLSYGAGNKDWFCLYGPEFILTSGDRVQINQPSGSGYYVIIEDGGADTPDFVSYNYHTSWMPYHYPIPDYSVDYRFAIAGNTASKIFGNVVSETDATPLGDTQVLLLQNGLIINGAITNLIGYYEFSSIDPGVYSLAFYKNGFNTVTYSNVTINEGERVQLDAQLNHPSTDLVIDGVDVLQVVETDYMIANKPTVIRIRSHVDGLVHVDGVLASVHVTGPGVDQTFNIPNQKVKQVYSQVEVANGDEAIELYYTPTTSGNYQFDVQLSADGISDSNLSNNIFSKTNVNFGSVGDKKILTVPIEIAGETPNFDELNASWQFVNRVFPLNSQNTFDVRLEPALVLDHNIQGGWEQREVLGRMWLYKMFSAASYNFISAILPGDGFTGSLAGGSNCKSPISISELGVYNGSENKFSTQTTVAHELFHTMANACDEDYVINSQTNEVIYAGPLIDSAYKPFEVLRRAPAVNWFNLNTNSVIQSMTRRSLRGASPGPDELGSEISWITKSNYEQLYNELWGAISYKKYITEADSLFIRGSVDESGVTTLDNIYNISSTEGFTPNDPSGNYLLELFDNSNNLLFQQKFDPSEITGGGGSIFGLLVPVISNVHKITILRDEDAVASRVISANTPTVNITLPTGGGTLTGTQTITWNANDVDGNRLNYSVFISRDDGATFEPLAVELTDTSYKLNTLLTSGCTNTCRIKVLANDGFHSTEAVSNSFSMDKKSPLVAINIPDTGITRTPGETIVLQGDAYDFEDGNLIDSQFSWSSNIDGFLGNGNILAVSSLSEGDHTITLQAQDSDSNISSTSIQVHIVADTDGDGMPDAWETQHGLNPQFDDSELDPDQDGRTNLYEYTYNTEPLVWGPYLQQMSNITISERGTLTIHPQLLSNPSVNPVTYTIDSPLFTWDGTYFKWQTGPTSSGNYTFTVTTIDENQQTDSVQVNVTVNNTCKVYNKYIKKWDCESNILDIDRVELQSNIN